MSSMCSVSFALLVNGVASPFFKSGRGLRQGCPLAPLLFLIVVEGLSRALLFVKDCGLYHGITFGNEISLSHVLFVDDIVMVTDGIEQSLSTMYEVLVIFSKVSQMKINEEKSALYFSNLDEFELITIQNIFTFSVGKIENGMKYLGFHLKCWRYLLKD